MTGVIPGTVPNEDDLERVIKSAVMDVQVWMRQHPGADYLDAAYAIAWRSGSSIGRRDWPQFIEAVKAAVEK